MAFKTFILLCLFANTFASKDLESLLKDVLEEVRELKYEVHLINDRIEKNITTLQNIIDENNQEALMGLAHVGARIDVLNEHIFTVQTGLAQTSEDLAQAKVEFADQLNNANDKIDNSDEKIENLEADVTTLEIDAFENSILIINGFGDSGYDDSPTNIINLKTGRLDYDQSEESFNVQGSGGAGGLIQGIPVYCGGYYHGYLDSCYKMGDTQPFYRMSSARYHSAYVVVNDYLWILGGYNGSKLSTSEFVSIDDGSSHNGPNLPVSLYGSCATVLQNGSVIISGGYQNGANADETFIYSFESATWTKGPKMNTKRRIHSCASFNDIVISTGGSPGGASTEILLPTASNWISGMKLN